MEMSFIVNSHCLNSVPVSKKLNSLDVNAPYWYQSSVIHLVIY